MILDSLHIAKSIDSCNDYQFIQTFASKVTCKVNKDTEEEQKLNDMLMHATFYRLRTSSKSALVFIRKIPLGGAGGIIFFGKAFLT